MIRLMEYKQVPNKKISNLWEVWVVENSLGDRAQTNLGWRNPETQCFSNVVSG